MGLGLLGTATLPPPPNVLTLQTFDVPPSHPQPSPPNPPPPHPHHYAPPLRSMLEAFVLGGDFHSRTAVGMYDHIKDAIRDSELWICVCVCVLCVCVCVCV